MSFSATILYPADAQFDLDYYLTKHMPMVEEKFKAHGLTGYRVTQLTQTAQGEAAPYSILCQLIFSSAEAMPTAFAAEREAVLGDIPNFSDKHPIIIGGDIKATSGSF